ncbi:SURF1 family cytochrome oxidase biogenesis protein [Sphingomonas sp.]|uniref:SURF1 family cytochrome oxidase biogenesis protein n=1 Tax=Sphingomonas sp. TaxID=28214 RepID=UPI0035B13DD5
MRRVPVIPTLVVGVLIAIMLALGFWQLLDRAPKKEAFLAQLAQNPTRPPVAFPHAPDERLLFRRTTALCQPPVAIRRAGAGSAGFRLIAECRGGMLVQLGTSRNPRAEVPWQGGTVAGYISHAPDHRSMIESLMRPRPQPMLLVLDQPVAGLAPNPRPSTDAVPNNHVAYAVQWFLFAVAAAIIYALALRRRNRPVVEPARAR